MRGNVTGTLGEVTKGEPGLSAYEIAVKHGYTGTEEEWLASLSANATPAEVAAVNAAASATAAANSAAQAQGYANTAQGHMNAARDSATEAAGSANTAHGHATTANTAAGTATADAAYIAGQIQGVLTAADLAAANARHATIAAGEAALSEAHAKTSEQNVALAAVQIAGDVSTATLAASNAAGSASEAQGYVAQAENVIASFNANTEMAHSYSTIAAGYANSAQNYAVSAANSADRAEAALGNALNPLNNYYTKSETESLVGGVSDAVTLLSSQVDGDIATIESSLGNCETSIGANHDAITLGAYNHSTLDAKVVSATDVVEGIVKLYDEPGENTDGTMTQGAIKSGIDNVQNALLAHVDWAERKITEVYKFKGSVAYWANLPASGNENGDVYNIRNANKTQNINAGDNVAWVDDVVEDVTTFEAASGTYIDGTTYYTDSTGETTVDTTGFEDGVTDVTSYYVAVTTPTTVEAAHWDKLAGIFVLEIASNADLGGVKIGSNIDIAVDGTISVTGASDTLSGAVKMYTSTGNNGDGTMSQYAITTAISNATSLASSVSGGTVKLYPTVGSATDGTMSQDAITTAISEATVQSGTANNIPTVSGSGNIWIG